MSTQGTNKISRELRHFCKHSSNTFGVQNIRADLPSIPIADESSETRGCSSIIINCPDRWKAGGPIVAEFLEQVPDSISLQFRHAVLVREDVQGAVAIPVIRSGVFHTGKRRGFAVRDSFVVDPLHETIDHFRIFDGEGNDLLVGLSETRFQRRLEKGRHLAQLVAMDMIFYLLMTDLDQNGADASVTQAPDAVK